MFWTTRLIDHFAKRDKKAEARGERRGIEIGERRGIEIGEKRKQAAVDREWVEWSDRKRAAEDAGEPFNEPSPAEKHASQENGTEEDPEK